MTKSRILERRGIRMNILLNKWGGTSSPRKEASTGLVLSPVRLPKGGQRQYREKVILRG